MDNKLFPDNFIAKLPNIKRFVNNPLIVFLLKSDKEALQKLKDQLEIWFSNIPQGHKRDIANRIRSINNKQHLAAFYELVWHQFFIEEGHSLIIHPLLPNGKHPDFKIVPKKYLDFFFEVATVFEERERASKEKRFDELLGLLDTIEHYFCVLVTEKSTIPDTFQIYREGKEIKQFLLRELDKLDPKTQTQGIILVRHYQKNGISIEFEIIPWKENKKQHIIGGAMPTGSWGDAKEQIQRSLQHKVKKYKGIKESGKPLVIAICSSGHHTVDEDALESALFGNPQLSWVLDGKPGSEKWGRDLSGLITPKPAFQNPRNTRLTAVIFCDRKISGERMGYIFKVYHNPWAANPLPEGIFQKLPQLIVAQKTNTEIQMKWINNNPNLVIIFN